MSDTGFNNRKIKITVARMLKFDDLAEQYNQSRPGIEQEGNLPTCPFFREGQEFIIHTDPYGNCKPEGFCDWAWADIWKDVILMATRAGLTEKGKRDTIRPHFSCCTDGLRPVVFCFEAMEEDA